MCPKNMFHYSVLRTRKLENIIPKMGRLGPLHYLHTSGIPYPGAPCLQIIPTLGPNVYKKYLHWAIWSLRVRTPTRSHYKIPDLPSRRAAEAGFGVWGSGFLVYDVRFRVTLCHTKQRGKLKRLAVYKGPILKFHVSLSWVEGCFL